LETCACLPNTSGKYLPGTYYMEYRVGILSSYMPVTAVVATGSSVVNTSSFMSAANCSVSFATLVLERKVSRAQMGQRIVCGI
jgi:hypothetical protein